MRFFYAHFRLKYCFPRFREYPEHGIVAVGGDLSPDRLILAYKSGIFPWFEQGEPIMWWSPDPRFVLFPNELKVSKSMRQLFKKEKFTVTVNKAFEEVVYNCQIVKRKDQDSTWITDGMLKAYSKLNLIKMAISVEVWQEENLVGGLYGVDVGNGVFCGESMFSKVSNASKYGFIHFVKNSNYKLIDCQVHTNHLESLGAREIDRSVFIDML